YAMANRASRRVRDIHADETAPVTTQPAAAPAKRRATMERSTPLAAAYRFPLFVAAVHLVIVQVAAFIAQRYGDAREPSPPLATMPPPMEGLAHYIVEPLRNWDGLWYRLIAIEGYDYHQANAAFWPLFPMSMRTVSRATGMAEEVAGYLIANVTFAVALVLLY